MKKVISMEDNILSSPIIDKDDYMKDNKQLQIIDSSRDQEQEEQEIIKPLPAASQRGISERSISEDIDFGQRNLESRIKNYENAMDDMLGEHLQTHEVINTFNDQIDD